MELENRFSLVPKFLWTHGHCHFHLVNIPLSPLSAVHPHAAVAHVVFVLQVIQGVHDRPCGTHMGAMRVHQVVVKENLVRPHLLDKALDDVHIGIGEFALAMRVVDVERHAQVIEVAPGHSHLPTSHHGLAQHDGTLEIAQIVGVVIGCAAADDFRQRILNKLETGTFKMLGEPVGQQQASHQVVVAHCDIGICLEGDAHVVTLLYQPADCTAHRHHSVVGMRAEDEHTLGVGGHALGPVSIVGVWLTPRPTCDGVLQVVEYLDIDIICRVI